MRTIIAGGRDKHLTLPDMIYLGEMKKFLPITEVVSGRCRGIDRAGEVWAIDEAIPLAYFPADWTKHGKPAGFIRNQEMADYADALIAFPGGDGTADMIKRALKRKLRVYDCRNGHTTKHDNGS